MSSCPAKNMTEEIEALAKELGTTTDKIVAKIDELHEFNPMMGHPRLPSGRDAIRKSPRCRPVRSSRRPSRSSRRIPATTSVPEIMIPLVGEVKELKPTSRTIVSRYRRRRSSKSTASSLKYKVGTMIEIPRAAVTADEIAKEAEFFSFGTNDLTQMTFGFSRDDAGKFLGAYYDKKIYESDPFAQSGPERRRQAGEDGR